MPLCTLAGPVTATQEIKKSRFTCQAAPVASPAAALQRLELLRDAQATHNCWAYRLDQQYRFSDDGEPGGTAGRPILQAIDGQGFDRILVVVTRWYGGIKLGAGGLIRAYGGCAAECLRTAARLPLLRRAEVEVALPFAVLALVQARLGDFQAECLQEQFDADGAILRLALPSDAIAALNALLADLTRGRSSVRVRD